MSAQGAWSIYGTNSEVWEKLFVFCLKRIISMALAISSVCNRTTTNRKGKRAICTEVTIKAAVRKFLPASLSRSNGGRQRCAVEEGDDINPGGLTRWKLAVGDIKHDGRKRSVCRFRWAIVIRWRRDSVVWTKPDAVVTDRLQKQKRSKRKRKTLFSGREKNNTDDL